jgi:hypothetical protein
LGTRREKEKRDKKGKRWVIKRRKEWGGGDRVGGGDEEVQGDLRNIQSKLSYYILVPRQ